MSALALNTVALVVEVGAGIPAKSLSLVMDGVHNISDEVGLTFLVLAYTPRVGLSGRFLRSANLFNSLGLMAITAVLGWQVVERLRQPQAVARVLREPSAEDPAIRLAYVHNLGDGLVSLGPVLAGALMLITGSSVVDPVVALAIAVAIVVPTLPAVVGAHKELVWPQNVACGHAAGETRE